MSTRCALTCLRAPLYCWPYFLCAILSPPRRAVADNILLFLPACVYSAQHVLRKYDIMQKLGKGAYAVVFKAMDMRHHSELIFMQSALSFAFPWAAYYTSESLELSGIVTIMACGIVMAQYTRNNFSEEAVRLTAPAYMVVAMIAETDETM